METPSPLSQSGRSGKAPCIRTCFAPLSDPRRRRKRIRHPLLNLVVIALCGTIAGADGWEDIAIFADERREWLARFLDLSKGLPSHDTLGRVFAALDPIAFQKCLVAWIDGLHRATKGQVIAIDGKAAKEAMIRAGDQGPLMLVSAWATENRVLLGQVTGPEGSGECAALPKLLELLDLNGAIVTLDALGCQRGLVRQIVDQGGDYLISVKGNQDRLYKAVQRAFDDALEAEGGDGETIKTQRTRDTSHGRDDVRVIAVLEVPKDSPDQEQFDQWSGLQTLVMATREGEDSTGTRYLGVRYFISSLPAKAKRLADVVRSHWRIENELHWVLDVEFGEDRSRARQKNSQANLGALRRTALSLLKNAPGLKGSTHSKRLRAAYNGNVLETVLFASEARQD
jgi:predicted transposase YbfD/YdcC